MALRTLMLRHDLDTRNARLQELRTAYAAFATRERELEGRIEQAETEEQRTAVQADVDAFEAERGQADTDIAALEEDIRGLTEQINTIEAAAQSAARDGGTMPTRATDPNFERRCAEFQRTGRMRYEDVRSLIRAAIVTSTTGVIGPTGVSGINAAAGAGISSIIDLIKVTDCTGMSGYKVAYDNGDSTAAAGTEGSAPAESEPTFAYVEMTPTLYNIISYVSKQIRKQSPLDYEARVQDKARTALRKILNKTAVDAIIASSINDTLALSAAAASTTGDVLFDGSLLSSIILSYGGDEGVDGAACLFLNKKDLKAFAAVRGKNEYLPVYSIVPDTANPNTGIIKDNNGLSCRYCLSKDVTALSDMTLTTSAQKTMFYGNPQCAELALWGSVDVEVNDGYKFAEGLLTIMGECSADVDVTVKNGFVVVTAKKAA